MQDASHTQILKTRFQFFHLGGAIQSAENRRVLPSFFRTQQWKTLEFGSTPSGLLSLKLMFDRSKLESLCDVKVTRIGDTLSYGLPQTL